MPELIARKIQHAEGRLTWRLPTVHKDVEGDALPWCDSCDVYLAPNTVSEDGSCPTCDSEVDNSDAKVPPTVKVPWHFWLIVVALVLYLGWRFITGIGWLVDKF